MDDQVSGFYPLTSGRQVRNLAVTLVRLANLILSLYYFFNPMSNLFSTVGSNSLRRFFLPSLKDLGFQTEM